MDLYDTDDPDYKRDPKTGILIHVNNKDRNDYIRNKENKQIIREMQHDINETRQELKAIKELLLKSLREE